jgi:transcriptional regulator with XRE-family HTH domain
MTSPRDVIGEIQRSSGVSQRHLAQRLGVAPSTVTRWKLGAAPRHHSARLLWELSGRTPAELVESQHPLRRARVAAGLSVRELAVRVPSSPTAVSHWEAGRRRPGEKVRGRLAEILVEHTTTVDAWFDASPVRREYAVPGLVYVRRERGWSQRDVARAWGVSASLVQRLESTRRRLDATELAGLVAALELDASEQHMLSLPVLRATQPSGTRAEQLRRGRSVTLSLAAARARTSQARLRAIEQGQLSLDLGTARRLALVYGVPLRTLMGVFGEVLPPGLERGTWSSLSLPAALRLLRAYSGLRWQDLSRLTGRSESTLRRWHTGQRCPDSGGVRLLEVAYGLDVGRLGELL